MRTRLFRLSLPLALALIVSTGSAAAKDTWRFKVFLDRSPIGEHRFERRPVGDSERVFSRATFDVDILVFNAYRYRHESNEVWRGDCLERIRSTTDDNGADFRLEGERDPGGFNLNANGEVERLPSCVSTFAYWDKSFLERRQLLNPQTGQLLPVRVESQGTEQVDLRGRKVVAERYRLSADGLDITLWYTRDGDWVGLQSDTGKGKILRYERL